MKKGMRQRIVSFPFWINENHAIVAWFKKGNADEYRQENSDCI